MANYQTSFSVQFPVGAGNVEAALAIYKQMEAERDDADEAIGFEAEHYYWIARGVDQRPVRADRIRKSVGAENTFSEDLTTLPAMHEQLRPLAEKVWTHCQVSGTRGRTVTLKVKYADFQQVTRSCSFSDFVPSVAVLESTALDLLKPLLPVRLGVRLLGVTLSSLNTEETPANQQLTLAI